MDLVLTPEIQASLSHLQKLVGKEVGVTSWERFDQDTVSRYGSITGEDLWIHTDPERAAASRFRSPLVQASLLMARFGSWIRTAGAWLPEPAVPINYGYDRIRIPNALPVGEDVRGRVRLVNLVESESTVRMHLNIVAERRTAEKSVIVADWLVTFLLNGEQ